MEMPQKLNIELPYDAIISLLGIFKRIESRVLKRYFAHEVSSSIIYHSQRVEAYPYCPLVDR